MKFASIFAAGLLAMAATAQAQTTTLLSLTDPVYGTSASYSLNFVATSSSSTLSDGGYQLPGYTNFLHNSVVDANGGSNLLGQTWDFTPAPIGSLAGQSNDGTSVNALVFGGVGLGSYDVFSQTFATTVGDTYTYTFDTSNFAGNPDGYFVTVSNAILPAVPEPASWGLMLVGLGLVGRALRKRQAAR